MNGSSCVLNDLSAKSSLFFSAKLSRWTRHIMMAGNLIVGVPADGLEIVYIPTSHLCVTLAVLSLNIQSLVGWFVSLCIFLCRLATYHTMSI
jgi:hypothetical protein